jgi:proteic killer suppression protein
LSFLEIIARFRKLIDGLRNLVISEGVFPFIKPYDEKVIRFFANLQIIYYLCTQNKTIMVVTFNEDYLEKLYSKGETGTKKIWFQPQIVRGYQKGIKYLIQAKRKEDLYPFKSLHFEALHGDKEGRFSIKANDQYRIEFTLEESDEEPVVTICNIMELSNHYK